MTFKNETSDPMEICVPIVVQASIRFHIQPGEELTAKAVNDAVAQLAWAASDDVFRHPRVDGDWSMNVLGVEQGGVADFYNHEKEGETPLPEGVEYAPAASSAPADDGWALAELQRVRERANVLETLLAQAVDGWPQFDSEDDVNGGDLVEWFGQWRSRAKVALDA